MAIEENRPMATEYTPMRWPSSWKGSASLDLLKGTAVNCLVIERGADLGAVAARARQLGITVAEIGSPPAGVVITDGEWPGVKLTETGAVDRVSAGPTGAPWVDSNGWKVRLTAALNRGKSVWVDVAPKKPRLSSLSYQLGVADAAAHGARWIISLDERLAAGIVGGQKESLQLWKKLTDTAGFFSARRDWTNYQPESVVGIVSDFSGTNELLTHEILNLVARTNQQYLIIPKKTASRSSFGGLRALIYADEDPPEPGLRKEVLMFVRSGGMLITGPKWGELPGLPSAGPEHPRYVVRSAGKGKVAVSKGGLDDPYLIANDSQVLISHRHELLRFWNAGAVGSYFTAAPGRERAVVQMLFYARLFGDNRPSVRIAGRYRKARLWTMEQQSPQPVELEIQEEALELHMPPVAGYAAAELEV